MILASSEYNSRVSCHNAQDGAWEQGIISSKWRVPRLRNSADSEINNWVSGPLEFIGLPGKLTDQWGNCADAAGEVRGMFSIISPLESVVQKRVPLWIHKILFWRGPVGFGNRERDRMAKGAHVQVWDRLWGEGRNLECG